MHEELNQKISQLLDNELAQDEALYLLQKMQLQPGLQAKLNRYEAISHALKTDVFVLPEADFAARISQQIQQEPSFLLPKQKRPQAVYRSLALAATLAGLAVFASWRVIQHPEPASTVVAPIAQASTPQKSVLEKPALLAQEKTDQIPLNQRINDYLQAHNNSVYTNGEANFKPYTQVTAFSRE